MGMHIDAHTSLLSWKSCLWLATCTRNPPAPQAPAGVAWRLFMLVQAEVFCYSVPPIRHANALSTVRSKYAASSKRSIRDSQRHNTPRQTGGAIAERST